MLRHLALRHYLIARSIQYAKEDLQSATVVIPARNERGNIEPIIRHLPRFAERLEIIFVEGHSSDGTLEEMHRVSSAYSDRDIKVIVQPEIGKADAVYAAFDIATSDVLMILDSNMTVLPEQLPKFWTAICEGKGEFIYGSRIHLSDGGSFDAVFEFDRQQGVFIPVFLAAGSALHGHSVWNQSRQANRLCAHQGWAKILWRFRSVRRFRSHLWCVEVKSQIPRNPGAIRLARTYGTSQISRLHHGFALAKMAIFAFFKIKAL